MNFRKQKGVTLIALVVTVIVLLILAGVSITTLFDQNDKDLISKTYSTKELAETSQELEQDKLDDLYGYGIYPPDDEVLAPDTEVTDSEVTEPEVTPSGNVIPEGGEYTQSDGTVLGPGDSFPDTVEVGDLYTYGDFKYKYNYYHGSIDWVEDANQNGWGVRVLSTGNTEYGEILSVINGVNVTCMTRTFAECSKLIVSPRIPETVTSLDGTYGACYALTTLVNLPDNVTNMSMAFQSCSKLKNVPAIPKNITNLYLTFWGCSSLTKVPDMSKVTSLTTLNNTFYGCTGLRDVSDFVIPSSVKQLSDTFENCTYLVTAPVIPSTVNVGMVGTFKNCKYLTGTIEINGDIKYYSGCFEGTSKSIVLTGSSPDLAELAATSSSGNVTVSSN